jgi:hypothetical protein
MSLRLAYGTQKRQIMAALWSLSLFKFGDNPRQVPLSKHAGPFQWPEWLFSVFKNRSCQGLSPTPVGDNVMSLTENIPKTAIITPFGLFEYFSHLLGCPTLHKLFKE